MKKFLSVFAAVNLISISSLQLISCNEDAKEEVVKNNQSEDKNNEKDKDKDNEKGKDNEKDKDNNGNNTHETKPLTAQQVVDELVTKFEAKKTNFIKKINDSIPNTVADFYKEVEDTFKTNKEKEYAEVKYSIKDKNTGTKPFDKIKDATNKIYVGDYNILINIHVKLIFDHIEYNETRDFTFDYIIPAKDIVITPNIDWIHEVNDINIGTNSQNFKKQTFPFPNWDDYNVNLKTYKALYTTVTVEYEFEFKGYITTTLIKKTEIKDLPEEYVGKEYFGEEYLTKEGQPNYEVNIGFYIGVSQDYYNLNSFEVWMFASARNHDIWGEKQFIELKIHSIIIHAKEYQN